jgi:RNA polymerase sigma-70 factor (ECF subfamily)
MTAASLTAPMHLAAPVARGESESPRARERALVEACRRGEREAFDQVVERYQREVYRICYRYVNDHHDASDLAQETFLRAYRAIRSFRGDSALRTWLYRIAVNACMNFQSARFPPTEAIDPALSDGGVTAFDALAQEDRARLVRDAVRRLPEKQRATLILKVYQELSHEEVARVLGSSVGTVKANLVHALGNLRKLVGRGGRE